MSDTLSLKQIKNFREQLQSLKDDLTNLLLLSSQSADVVELDQSRVGRLSRMDAMQQQQMASAGKRRQQLQLELIEKAMQKIIDEEYGECIECGEYISFERLQIRPESELCIACQNTLEMNH
jgi:DnaK suppressor protein